MAIIKSLFNKKGKSNTDGQEEFFKEDFPPVVNQPAGRKAEAKPAQAKKPAEPKKATAKKPSSKRVAPQPVEKIINPKSAKKKTEVKASKPAAKKEEPKKAAAKPVVKKAAPVKNAAPAKKANTKSKKTTAAKEIYDDSPEIKGAVAIKESKPNANGKWDIRRAKDGRFFFSLYASNHTVIAYSQILSSTSAVATGISSVISNATKAEIEDTTLRKTVSLPCPKWEIYLDKAEQYRFRLYAPNGLCVCHSSHGYATKGGCKGGIESIKRFASDEAKVDKSYLNK